MRYTNAEEIKTFVGALVKEGASCTALVGGKKHFVRAGDLTIDGGCLRVACNGNNHYINLDGISSVSTSSNFKTVTLRFKGRESSPVKLTMTHSSIF